MADYISVPIEIDSATLEANAIDFLEAQVPGWTANDANLETWIIQAVARMAHEAALVASEIPTAVFRYYGASVASLPPNNGTTATLAGTVQVSDSTAERVLPAGTFLDVGGAAFETTNTVIIPVGVASSAVGALAAKAVEIGAANNGKTTAVLIDSIAWLAAIAVVGSTSGGVDAETDEVYLERLVEELRLMAPRPIIPSDFETLAKRTAGVARAVAIDGYNPANATSNNERMVTVVPVTTAGAAVPAAAKTALDASLQSLREVNFVVNVIDPTFTAVDIVFTAKAHVGTDPAAVELAAEAAVLAYLSPAAWGQPRFEARPRWINTPVVRYLEVAEALQRVDGLDYIQTLTVNGGSVDVTLPGAAPLPSTASTAAGTVT